VLRLRRCLYLILFDSAGARELRDGLMTDIPRSWFAKLIRNPVAILGAVGSLFVVLANAGPAIDGSKNLWRRWAVPPSQLETNWQGSWKSREGFTFGFAMQLEVRDDGAADGQISWQMLETPPDSFLAPRTGDSAIEFVSGTYDRETRVAVISGHKVSDPTLLALDTYKFQIKPDNVSFVGMSKHRGEWEAQAGGTVIVTEKP